MKAKIYPSKLIGKATIPSCKALAHRYILASFLSNKDVRIKGIFEGNDILKTLGAVKLLGANTNVKFDKNDKDILEINFDKIQQQNVYSNENDMLTLDIGESGSTLRFLLPICSALGKHVKFVGTGRIYDRPIDELVRVLEDNGITFISKHMPVEIKGKLSGGLYIINPESSSQYITGLLLALPLLGEDSRVVLSGQLTSSPYIDLTLSVLYECGIIVEKTDYGYFIKGNQHYNISSTINVESDWSSAGYFAVLGTFKGDVTINGLKENSMQGDKKIIEILSNMGANIIYKNGAYLFNKSSLNCTKVDVKDIPDMAPLLACVFALSNGNSIMTNVDRLRLKESDRLQAIEDMLDAIKIQYEYNTSDNGTLVIHGNKKIKKDVHFNGCNDHRIVMCQTVLSLILGIESTINYAEAVNKSFPSFFYVLKELGAQIEVLNE